MELYKSEEISEVMLNDSNQDNLRDIFQKTFHDAAKSLSQLVGQNMIIDQYKIEQITSEEFSAQVEEQFEQSYFASIIKVEEDLDTNIAFLIQEEAGLDIYRLISGEQIKNSDVISENVIAGIGEMNNILGSSFINSLANHLGITIHGIAPINTFDMFGAIIESIVLQEEFLNREIICADAKIREEHLGGYDIRLIIMSDKERLYHTLEQI
ncbi:hypothetical protein HQ585_06415 [candidate division KSB1 bacterium]|nr:hypothetical protein [candidate division KSB1 bacterium]